MKYKKIIYISHKFGGKRKNAKRAEKIIKGLMKEYPDYLFISPIHCFGYAYKDFSYEDGMRMCIALLNMCTEMWVCSEPSRGVQIETDYCRKYKKPISYLWGGEK